MSTDNNSPSRVKKAAIVGLANSGKTSVFNNLTGEYGVVANYPLTTVEIKQSLCRIHDEAYEIFDTPGLHCLFIHSEEELVIRDFLLHEKPDVIIQCIDANRLKQSLSLTLDLLELEIPMIISLNAIDETSKRGIWIDSKKLSSMLDIEVVESITIRGLGVNKLKKGLLRARTSKKRIEYSDNLEKEILSIEEMLPQELAFKRKVAILLLMDDPFLLNSITSLYGAERGRKLRREISSFRHSFKGNISLALTNSQSQFVDELTGEVIRRQDVSSGGNSQKIAGLCRNPLTGIPIMISLMVALYFLVVNVANFFAGWLESILWLPVESFIHMLFKEGFVNDLLIGDYGVLSLGLGNAIITILPILSLFFLFYNTLEDIGYIPNLSVMSRRICEKLGLSGAAICPLVLALGCKTMATLTTKSLSSKKERFIAIYLITIGIPCGAQLGVNMNMLSKAGLTALFTTFGLLIIIDTIIGLFLNKILKEDERSFYIQEIPPIRLPSPKAVLKKTFYRLYWFLQEAVPVFVYAALALFALDRIGVLNLLRHLLAPVIGDFLGFPDQMLDIIIVCIARHEVAAAMIMELVDKGVLNYVQTIVAAFVIMLIPCVANVGAVFKELPVKTALVIVVSIYISAFVISGLLNHLLLVVFAGRI